MIRCFIFDIHGVIFNTGGAIRKKLAQEGFAMDKLIAISGRGPIGSKYIRGMINYATYEAEVRKLFPDAYKHIIEEYYTKRKLLSLDTKQLAHSILQPYDITLHVENSSGKITTLEFIKLLASLQYSLCVFSGNTRSMIDFEDKDFHFLQYFRYKVFSFVVGVDKPDIKMFTTLTNTLPFSPEECIYIDDKRENIRIGNMIGFHSFLMRTLM